MPSRGCKFCGIKIEWDADIKKFINAGDGEIHKCATGTNYKTTAVATKFIPFDDPVPLGDDHKLIVKRVVKNGKNTGLFISRMKAEQSEDERAKGLYILHTVEDVDALITLAMKVKKAIG